ncbi:T9SS C-terminal target domain-containing protein [Segetibacter koreensis]|uniref:T9SS C-terminal target domain-containing protein n=1 Tax=Segetibacter koreensis TaxID=398037 RepID=UPI00037FE327|nr:T9SS C-terminal target domain-containing protein [Segetibacter koreensis]
MKFLVFPFFLLLLSGIANGQLCNGNLGDAIINTTFGNIHKPLPRTTTTYEYAGGCPAAGQYTIHNFLFGCGNRTWVKLTGDHTGGYNGNYMLVNAESSPGNIYVDTVTGLCSNTTYQFAAYITSVMQKITCDGKAVLPDIIFTAETLSGTVIARYNTGDLPLTDDKQWKEYGLSFTNPPGITVVILRISIKPGYGCGSAFALDDITLKVCGPPVAVAINGNSDSALDLCEDYTSPIVLNATYGYGFSNPVVMWQNSIDTGKTWNDMPGETSTTYIVPHMSAKTVLYRILIAENRNINSPKCRIASNPVSISVHPLPAHRPLQNLLGCLDKDLVLPYADVSARSVRWTGPNNYFSTNAVSTVPNIQANDTGLYKIYQKFDYGCTSLDSFYLKVAPSVTIAANSSYALCENSTITLTASGGETYKWTPSYGLSNDTIANPVANPSEKTVYTVTASNSYGCKDSAFVTVNVYKNPFANASNNITMIKGDTATLPATVAGTSVNVSWTPALFINDSHAITPKIFPPYDMQYTLSVASSVGCGIATSTVFIKVFDNFYIPSAFTPNDDGVNDRFKVMVPSGYALQKFIVYNRWGQKVYSGKDASSGWDGNVNDIRQQTGTFIYEVEMKTSSGKKIFKKGTVMLIR